MNKTCIILAGPTAIGKTSLAISLAQHFSMDIISADSRQCYKELNIGVAKPSASELEKVHHYFINSHFVKDDLSAAEYEKYALTAADEIFKKNDVAIVTGGTGLYIKAFCEGLDNIPAVDENIRQQIIENYQTHGIAWLQQELQKKDPLFCEKGEMQNPQRMMRALEVVTGTGKSIFTFRSHSKVKRPFRIIKILLEMPRELLYERINHRVDMMISEGLVAEAKALIPFRSLNALQTVGYREMFDYFDAKCSLETAISLIKQNTRHYAKRQITWFKKDTAMMACKPEEKTVLELINRIL